MEDLVIFSQRDLTDIAEEVSKSIPMNYHICEFDNSTIKYLTVSYKYSVELIDKLSSIIERKTEDMFVKKILLAHCIDEKVEINKLIQIRLQEERLSLIKIIANKLEDIFDISEFINIDGFINFCLLGYREELEFIIDEVLDEYYIQKEYLDFIELLSYFIEIEECGMEELNILISEENSYTFFDKNLSNITQECIDIFYNEFWLDTPVNGDFLICVLLAKCPKKINIYGIENIDNKNILQTLRYVFKDRIKIFKNIKDLSVK